MWYVCRAQDYRRGDTPVTGEFGYAGRILRVDLSSRRIASVPTSDYATRFLGGRGIAAKVYWDEVAPEVKAFDPDNRLMFVTGPLAGVACRGCCPGRLPGDVALRRQIPHGPQYASERPTHQWPWVVHIGANR